MLNTRYATNTLPNLADAYGIELPDAVEAARDRVTAVRSINPARLPVPDLVAPILEASGPAAIGKAFDKALAAHVIESARPGFHASAVKASEDAVARAVAENRDEIVVRFLTAAKVVEAVEVLADHAPTIPIATPLNPSLDRTPPALVASVAHVVGAWSFLGAFVKGLDPLLPGDGNTGPGLFVTSIEYVSEEQTQRVVHALNGRRDGTVSDFAAGLPGQSQEARQRGRVIPAVGLAHIDGVIFSVPSSLAEYGERLRAYADAISPGKWRPFVPQKNSESWVAVL
jgi:hypothetical protein